MTSLFDYVTSRLSNPGLAAIEDALHRVQALSNKHSEQAKMINLGATAWASGITPEMMNVFGNIASSLRITSEDIRRLGYTGITDRIVYRQPCPVVTEYELEISLDTGPFEEALKRYVEQFEQKTRPWLGTKDGEIWEITVDNENILCSTDTDGDFTPVFGHHHYATIANGSKKITAGRRIWPEPEVEEPTETAVAYALAYRALQELFVAVAGKDSK